MEEERKHPLTMWRGGLFLLALAMRKYCVCSGLHAPELSIVTGASYQATWMLWLEGRQHFWLEKCFSATVLPAQQKHYSQHIFFSLEENNLFFDCSEFCIPAVIPSFKILYYIICFKNPTLIKWSSESYF